MVGWQNDSWEGGERVENNDVDEKNLRVCSAALIAAAAATNTVA
jgi:hypothetical protein